MLTNYTLFRAVARKKITLFELWPARFDTVELVENKTNSAWHSVYVWNKMREQKN